MADAKQDQKAAPNQEKKAKGGKEKKAAAPREHAGAGLPVPPARLRVHYQQVVRQALSKQFGYGNPHQIPTLEKIVVNVGLSEAIKQPKLLDSVVDELGIITGQRPVRKKAKKSIANFGLRQGQEIGASVTLRGARMWEFLDRFITVAVPRIRDFRGLSTRSFDGRGNYSVGIKEQMIFPEINYDQVEQIHGMDITFVTSAEKDEQALALLRELGMPFRGEDKPVVVQHQ
ncbi:MAG: 50S ribosomal protein L5 [Gemmatimonadota bacterium]|nr:50S ribosomal protein L5 [Gemmatimonadota bacterium]